MKLVDVAIAVAVLSGTLGVVLVRALASIHEYRVQRRMARILERNADLLERDSLDRTPMT